MSFAPIDNIYDLMLDELRDREIAHYSRFGPFYIVSVGAHMFNIVNKTNKVFYWQGRLRDTRLHVFFVTPSGYGKTMFLEQFIDDDAGLLANSGIHVGFEQEVTTAGWTGTTKREEGKEIVVPGLVEDYKDGICGMEEFGALVAAMQQTHSRGLDTTILTSLDSGRVRKKIGAAKNPHFETHITLWSGTQVARFDISQGMGRRLEVMNFFPTENDKLMLREKRRKGQNVRYNVNRLQQVRSSVTKKFEDIMKIRRLMIDASFYQTMNKYRLQHYDEPLFENMAIGYYIMKNKITETLVVTVDHELDRLIQLEAHWRQEIRRGAEISQIIQMIKEAGGEIAIMELRNRLADFQIDYAKSSEIILDLCKKHVLISTKKGTLMLTGGIPHV